MIYPDQSQYIQSISSAAENFDSLVDLRPVLQTDGLPYMDSGNFSVLFKMTDGGGRKYALKCFTRDWPGRAESYKKISDTLAALDTDYLVGIEYLERELFVDVPSSSAPMFPVLKMDWVEGEALDKYLKRVSGDREKVGELADRFTELACWLLRQPIAHGDIKPDNILVRWDGSLVLVDYDGMYVPSMLGEQSRENGTPPYVHPCRKQLAFDIHIDDYPLILIALLLRLSAASGESYEDLLEDAGKSLLLERCCRQECLEDARIASLLTAYHIVQTYGVIDSSVATLLLSAGEEVEKYKRLLQGKAQPVARAKVKKEPGSTINGHAYVDMGLSVKWATCNVGASSPEDYGDYYAWGETKTKSSYTEDNCETWEKEIGDIGGTNRDVAHVKWGGSWRMPTEAEFDELLNSDNCTWTWTTRNGVNGYVVKSKKNGNSIFLPAAGYRDDESLGDAGQIRPLLELDACRGRHSGRGGAVLQQWGPAHVLGRPQGRADGAPGWRIKKRSVLDSFDLFNLLSRGR